MNNESLKVFVDSVSHYFDKVSGYPASVSAPFLIQNINDRLLDYTGIIGISGNHKGSVFVSAPKELLAKLLGFLGVEANSDARLMDLVGEISNTISGNARREFGDDFMLSTPIVLRGKSDEIQVSKVNEIFVIPIVWQNMKANVIINLSDRQG